MTLGHDRDFEVAALRIVQLAGDWKRAGGGEPGRQNLRYAISELPDESIHKLRALMYYGRDEADEPNITDFRTFFDSLPREKSAEMAIQSMVEKTPLALYLLLGLTAVIREGDVL